jgi:glucose-6-phosphate 1-dehydrogenase
MPSSAPACTFVIFGATGDLAARKLVPALYRLFREERLSPRTRLLGCARSRLDDEGWRARVATTTQAFDADGFDAQAWARFAARLHYQPLDLSAPADMRTLAARLAAMDGDEGGQAAPRDRVYYLATAPASYPHAIEALRAPALSAETAGRRRLVVEKPFGTDLDSARELNAVLHRCFDEDQIFRIDHYLGKESVQNLLVLRFANSIFEPVWNRNYIDHVQITVAEEVDVGSRGGYYDTAGVLRDMFQNHLLQLMTITAMEAPARYEPDLVRDEKVKVLRSIRCLRASEVRGHSYRGQYAGYTRGEGVPADSQTETFGALKLFIDNWRWQGVPFYLRSGKAMSCRTTQIVVQFREPPHMLFQRDGDDDVVAGIDANRLVMQIQPAEGIQLHFQTKVPDAGMRTRMTDLDYRFDRHYRGDLPDAYQRLLLDAATGDASLFARSDEVELAWTIIDPVTEGWRQDSAPPLALYRPGAWGPAGCDEWLREQGREWFNVCPVLH